jgi:hypothetical protein
MLFFGQAQLDVAANLVGRLIIVTTRSVQETTRQMKHELPNGGVRPPNMNPLIEPEDPDCRVHAAWLAQVSKAGDRLLAKEAGGNTRVSASASTPADRLAGQEVRLAPAQVDRRSGLITKVLIGCGAAIAAVITIPSYLSFFETWQQPTGDPIELTSPDPVKSATPPMQNESETRKLVVEPMLGAPGEPVPIGLALRGPANDAVVILRGLVPGMELSTGGAVSGDTWQLSATDLPYAWIAPPEGFVGSADLVAELRLSNDKIADRRAIHLEWMTPAAPRPELDRESIPKLQPDRQDVQPQRIIDTPHVAFLPLPQGVPQSTGTKGSTVESRVEPEITNSTCFASASAVRQDHPDAWPSWTLRALGHEGTKCWYPTTRTLAHDHPR